MNWIKSISKNIAAMSFGLLIAFLILELFLKFFNPFPFRVKGDELVLPAHQNLSFQNDLIPSLDSFIHHQKNSLGFRGPEYNTATRSSTKIITVGGSTTECLFLSEGQTWSDVLYHELLQNGLDIWLNNAGLDGHSTFGHQLLFDDHLQALKADYILFLIGTNDVGTAGEDDFVKLHKKGIQFHSIKGFVKSLANHSEVVGLAFNFYRYSLAYRKGLLHHHVILEDLPHAIIDSLQVDSICQIHRKEFVEGYIKRVDKLAQSCLNNQAIPIFITQPKLSGNPRDSVSGIDLSTIVYNGETGYQTHELLDLYNQALLKRGKEKGYYVIDLASELPRDSRYYYDFTHYTPEGAAAVGKLIAKKLLPIFEATKQ